MKEENSNEKTVKMVFEGILEKCDTDIEDEEWMLIGGKGTIFIDSELWKFADKNIRIIIEEV